MAKVRYQQSVDAKGAQRVRRWIFGLLSLVACACANAPREPFTREEQVHAQLPGIPDVRFWNDDPPRKLLIEAREILRPARGASKVILALSRGGPEGAFGAGLLVG